MEKNGKIKGKYNKIILIKKKLQKRRNQIKSRKEEKIKLIIMKKKPQLKKNEVCLLFPTSNLHPNKQKYKSEKETHKNIKYKK